MDKKSAFSMLLGSALMLTGCGKKMNQFAADYFSTNPNPLEVVGQNVPATVTGNIPPKFFVKNATVTVTPYLTFDNTELAGNSMTFQGEKVRGNNRVISYDNGGTVTIPVNYVYKPEMQRSELYLGFTVDQKGKQYVLPRVKVADGIVATAALADAGTVDPATAADKFQRVINEKYKADILFLINVANLRENQLNSADMKAWNEQVAAANADDRREIKELNIESYASPDGPYDFNAKLAEKRETNTKGYLEKKLKKDNITEFGELTADFTPEDWEGFQELVGKSDIQDKDLILSVLGMYKDPAEREKEIRNMASVFDVLAKDILPQLRRSKLNAKIKIIGKSDEEIMNAYNTNPESLSVEELLYAGTLTDDDARQAEIYKTVTRLYPDDYRGYNNLGMAQYRMKDYQAAAGNFNQAAKRAPESREVKVNQALIALLNKDMNTAKSLLGNAGGVPAATSALGYAQLREGNTAAAAAAYRGVESNNAALAQIMNKDYSTASSTIAKIKNPDATTYYLAAILGARTNNSDQVKSNLQKAVQLDSQLGQRALNDLEFAKFDVENILR